jgi:hypothetical protein
MDELRARIAAKKAALDRLRPQLGGGLCNLEHLHDLELTIPRPPSGENAIVFVFALFALAGRLENGCFAGAERERPSRRWMSASVRSERFVAMTTIPKLPNSYCIFPA